jgi:hypothetical protein
VRVAVAGIAASVLGAAGPAGAADRTEEAVGSLAPDAKLVRESYVRLRDPLPAGSAAHPEACDWISYLRWRDAKGPKRATKADAIAVLMPGFLGGAKDFDALARNAIRDAAARKRHIEVWGIDRRANCLEDHHGVAAAVRARNIDPAFDYYYGGKEVDGRKFAGFKTADDARFLDDFGLERTVLDWYTLLTREVPSQSMRAQKVVCGGHSLGGPLTAAFASWDFDGDPQTTADAGYNQCVGFVGLDTTVDVRGADGGPGTGPGARGLVAQSGAAPFVNAPPLTPGTMELPSVASVAAYFHPDDESTFNKQIPNTPEYEVTLRALYSRNAANFATGQPSIRDFRLTGAAVFAGIFDDNSAGLSILRASLGTITGGEVADKNFPAPSPFLAIPTEPNGPLYRWVGYDKIAADGSPIPLNDEGQPYNTRDGEVTDVQAFARDYFESPADFIEQYFPTRILTDVVAAEGGDRSGEFANLRHDGPAMRPILLLQAGDSDDNEPSDAGPAYVTSEKPNDKPLSREIVIPGYNHLDVVAAARRQNDGHIEASSSRLALFVMKTVPRPKRKR